jgi:hypothetical protein
MIKNVNKGIQFIDPINDKYPGKRLDVIMESNKIKNPKKIFCQFLSP